MAPRHIGQNGASASNVQTSLSWIVGMTAVSIYEGRQLSSSSLNDEELQ